MKLGKLEDDFHITSGRLALDQAKAGRTASAEAQMESEAWFSWTRSPHTEKRIAATSQKWELGSVLVEVSCAAAWRSASVYELSLQ